MADFPTAKTNAVDNVTDVLAKHINNLENKVGIDSSTDTSSLDYKVRHVIPAGTITMFGGSSAPTGYLLCDGSAVSRTTYADLFTAIGTTYGTGDGSTTFNVPNVKGKVPVGRDGADTSFDALGETGGEKTHTLTSGEMPEHTHTQDAHYHRIEVGGASGGTSRYKHTTSNGVTNDEDSGGHSVGTQYVTATNQNTGGGEAHNNLQPYIVFNYIIKT